MTTYTVSCTTHRTVRGVHHVPGDVFTTTDKALAAAWQWFAQADVSPALTFSGTMLRGRGSLQPGDVASFAQRTAVEMDGQGAWAPSEPLGNEGEMSRHGPYTVDAIESLSRPMRLR